MASVIPVIGEYTQAGSEKALQKSDRFERIVREARQQSGSQVETKIYEPQKLQAALDMLEAGSFGQEQNSSQAQEAAARSPSQPVDSVAKLFFYERSDKTFSLSAALFGLDKNCPQAQEAAGSLRFATDSVRPRACVFAVGSEGGISPAERDLLLERGFKAVHFNTNILRCETAALYAAAAIQSALDN